jgi:hypothetical protein
VIVNEGVDGFEVDGNGRREIEEKGNLVVYNDALRSG